VQYWSLKTDTTQRGCLQVKDLNADIMECWVFESSSLYISTDCNSHVSHSNCDIHKMLPSRTCTKHQLNFPCFQTHTHATIPISLQGQTLHYGNIVSTCERVCVFNWFVCMTWPFMIKTCNIQIETETWKLFSIKSMMITNFFMMVHIPVKISNTYNKPNIKHLYHYFIWKLQM
jgi:hypothetical protein